jgi:hypothetical protein
MTVSVSPANPTRPAMNDAVKTVDSRRVAQKHVSASAAMEIAMSAVDNYGMPAGARLRLLTEFRFLSTTVVWGVACAATG